jgi:AraC family transcriptional regulator
MSRSNEHAYAQRFNRVFDFIDRHLNEPLSVESLSRIAHFSKFHFHRQFSDYAGITVGRYIQLARLRRASYRLVFNPLDRITDIALDVGFTHAESFSRAFKDALGQSPSEFRAQPDWLAWTALFQVVAPKRIQSMHVRTITVAPVTVAVLEHRGDPALVNESVQKFIAWRKESGLSPIATSQTYGIAYDNPDTTPAEDFRLDICGSVNAPVPANRFGIITKTIPGGRCAVVRHEGSLDDVSASVHHLYRNWLPASGEELRDFPVYFHYLNLRQNTPEHELLTDVHLPLK